MNKFKSWANHSLRSGGAFLALAFALSACSGAPSEIGTDFYPGIVLSPSASSVSISNLQVLAGSAITVNLFLKDTRGSPFVSTLPNVGFQISGGTSTGSFGPVLNNGDGSYTALFTGVTVGTAIMISPVVNGASISGTFPSVTVVLAGAAPSSLVYATNPATYHRGSAITANSPSNAGGLVSSYSVSPTLPSGLTLDATTGIISGTPTTYSASTAFTVTATNGGGSTTASVSIQVNDVPTLSYAAATGTAGTVGTAMTVTPTTLSNQGSALTGCAIKTSTPALPAWATLNTSSCVITGTPTAALSSTSYTINATNSVGASTDATVSLSAVYPVPTLTSITPSSGTRNGGTSVTIAGTGFYSGLTVTLGGNACTSITVTSTTQITCTTPAHTIGANDVVVTNSGTTAATLTNGFNFTSTAYTQSWDFNTSTDYTYDHTKIEFTGTAARLIASQQTDNSSSCSTGFGDGITASCGGTPTGTLWSGATDGFGSSNYTMLSQAGTATDLELSSTWAPAWKNIKGYWKLNETGSSTVADSSSGGNHTGNLVGTVTLGTSGQLNTAATLDGTSGYINLGNSLYDTQTQGTLSAWIKTTSVAVNSGVFSAASASAPNNLFYLDLNYAGGSYVNLRIVDRVNSNFGYGNTPIYPNQWYHIAATSNGSSWTLYVNGIAQTLTFTGGSNAGTWFSNEVSGTMQYAIGAILRSTGTINYFPGVIDDVAEWNVPLTGAAISAIYQHQSAKHAGTLTSRVMDGLSSNNWTTLTATTTLPFGKELPDSSTSTPVSEAQSNYSSLSANLMGVGSGTTGGIVGLWHLDETAPSGTGSVLDHSGNGYHGNPGSSAIFGASGKLGTAVSGTASSSAVGVTIPVSSATSALSLATGGSHTMSAWANISAYPTVSYATNSSLSGGVIFGRTVGTNWRGILPSFGGNIAFRMNTSASQYNIAATPGPSPGSWHLYTMVVDNTNLQLHAYIDGSEISGSPISYTGTLYNTSETTHPYTIGIGTPGDALTSGHLAWPFNGSVDEVGLWSRNLSSAEVMQLYRRGANRIRYQVRSCADNTCSGDPTWLGPDGSNQTYFSELNNNVVPKDGADLTSGDSVNAGKPIFTFSNYVTASPSPTPFSVPTNQWFQYRAIMESDDAGIACNYGGTHMATWCSPELQSVVVGPTHYDNSNPTIVNSTGVSYATLQTAFTPTASCTSHELYNLSSDGTHWYWYTAGAWAAADGTSAKANLGGDIDGAALTKFTNQYGAGNVSFKVFLPSGTAGINSCSIDNLDLGITH